MNPNTSYIVDIDVDAQNPLVLMDFNDILSHGIRINTDLGSCIMPVTNHYEID